MMLPGRTLVKLLNARFLAFAGEELDGRKASNTISGGDGLVGRVVGVQDGDVAFGVVLECVSDLGPSGLKVLTVLFHINRCMSMDGLEMR